MRRRRAEDSTLSLDSFLDIVTNVVGALILIAVVTVLGAGDISVSTGATSLKPTDPTAQRMVFQCTDNQIFFLDEERNARRVRLAIQGVFGEEAPYPSAVIELLEVTDIGDDTYRVQAEQFDQGLAWVYRRRPGATGDSEAAFDAGTTAFEQKLAELPSGSYLYFVVHDDSFEIFRRARDLARAREIPMGWHPVEGDEPLRMSSVGDLGKRIQ